jgi:isocitrate dehydrogenase (NAD+)
MSLRVTLVQSGGAGFDQVPAVQEILRAAGADIAWDEHLAGLASLEQGGAALPEAMLQSVRANGLALKTKLLSDAAHPSGNFNVQFRRELDLFAAVRPVRNLRGLRARHQGVDLVVIRELTEDLSRAIEHEIIPGVVQSLKVVTEAACRRFFRFAFEWSRNMRRKCVHCVHKANILKLADGLLLESFRTTARDYPDIEAKEIIVDNCCMQMVLRPQQFDVLAMGNLYGDLVSDLAAGVVGGISATSGINVGERIRVYEAFHGGTREQVGAGRANPLPLLLPAMDLLRSVGQEETAVRIRQAVESVLVEGRVQTPDLGGRSTTADVTRAIVLALQRTSGKTGATTA